MHPFPDHDNRHTSSRKFPNDGALFEKRLDDLATRNMVDKLIDEVYGGISIPEPDTNDIHELVRRWIDNYEDFPCFSCERDKARAYRRDLMNYMEAAIWDAFHCWARERKQGLPIEANDE